MAESQPEANPVPESAVNSFLGMMDAFLRSDAKTAEEFHNKRQLAQDDPKKRLNGQIRYLYNRFFYLADSNALAEIEQFTANKDTKYLAHVFKGFAYKHVRAFKKAAGEFEIAATISTGWDFPRRFGAVATYWQRGIHAIL